MHIPFIAWDVHGFRCRAALKNGETKKCGHGPEDLRKVIGETFEGVNVELLVREADAACKGPRAVCVDKRAKGLDSQATQSTPSSCSVFFGHWPQLVKGGPPPA